MPGLVIWVDAICINQHDDQERSAQVQLMSTIYSIAQNVQVWLGAASEDLELPVTQIQHWATIYGNYKMSMRSKAHHLDLIFFQSSGGIQQRSLSAIFEFAARPYWSRLWVVQELALSRHATIHYGNQTFSLGFLSELEPHMRSICVSSRICKDLLRSSIEEMPPDGMSATLESLAAVRSRLHSESSLTITLVSSFAHRETSDARDKIFALLGRQDEQDDRDPLIQSDYTKSVEEAYIDFARYIAQIGETFDVLRLSGIGCDGPTVLPSWVPDWRLVSAGSQGFYRHDKRLKVQGTSRDRVSLQVQGAKVDEIDDLLTVLTLMINQPDSIADRQSSHGTFARQFLTIPASTPTPLQRLFDLITPRKLHPETIEHKRMLAGFFKMLVQAQSNLNLDPVLNELYNQRIGAELLCDRAVPAEEIKRLRELGEASYPEGLSHSFDYLVKWRVNDSRLFITRGGVMGFGSPKLRSGDGVYSLKPDGALFAFRKEGDGGGEKRYSNSGECYIPSLARSIKGGSDESEYVDVEVR